MHEQLKPQPGRLDRDAAAHLWRRAGFGAPSALVENTMKLSPVEAARLAVRGPKRDVVAEEMESIYAIVRGSGSLDTIRGWLIRRMMSCEHQLREKMGLFWHGHFATSVRKVTDLDWMCRQYRLFLDLGLGRFPVLLDAVTRDPAMIRWLDNETNRKGSPNENFGRELFELFTLGDGNYTEKDIQEAGRAFTGWHILHGKFHFSAGLHDAGEKTVLGTTGNLRGEDVLKLALAQDACGRFLAGKLLRFFVEPAPSAELEAALGAEMKRNGYDVSATLELMFASKAFYAPSARRSLVKSPLEFVVGSTRMLETNVSPKELLGAFGAMGQELLAPPNVKGWPGGRTWINTATWLARINAAHRITREFESQRSGADACRYFGRALLGREPDARAQKAIVQSGVGTKDIVHALLALPESHLN
ncbi:MAG: DUF1800 domain-containing protein [Planctomycetota bacterium]